MLQSVFPTCSPFLCIANILPRFSPVLRTQGNVDDAYNTCSFVLLQLGETIPESVAPEAAKTMVEDTLKMYEEAYDDDWLERKMEGNTLRTLIKIYNVMAFSSYFCKSYSMVVYFTCKAVQLSLRNGICEHTPLSFLQFTGVVTKDDNAVLC